MNDKLIEAIHAALLRNHSAYGIDIQQMSRVEKGYLVVFLCQPNTIGMGRYQRCAYFAAQADGSPKLEFDMICG